MKPTSSQPTIGIIGGGFGALITYAVLRFRGISSQHIRVFTADLSPEKSWLTHAQAIYQRGMRSESIGHFYPTDSPGLATIEAIRSRSLLPIIRQWFDSYRPSVEFLIQHARQVAEQVGFWHSLTPASITKITRQTDSFQLWTTDKKPCATVDTVIMAVGHGPLNQPPFLQQWHSQRPDDRRVQHAFTSKQYYPNRTYLVVGDGLTAATEWMNILDAGSAVIAISQRGFTFTQALNTPRRYFSKRGIHPYTQKRPRQRRRELREATKGTIPHYYWRQHFATAHTAGRLRLLTGTLEEITATDVHLTALLRTSENMSIELPVDHVICATGFLPAAYHPLFQQLIADMNIAQDPLTGHLQPDNNCRLAPGLYVVGAAAAWALPNADSLNGMKLAARRIAKHLLGPNKPAAQLHQWIRLTSHKVLL